MSPVVAMVGLQAEKSSKSYTNYNKFDFFQFLYGFFFHFSAVGRLNNVTLVLQQPPARPLADPATAPPAAPCRWRRPHCGPRVASSDVNRLPITASESSALTTFRRLIYWRLLKGHPTGESTAAVPVIFLKKVPPVVACRAG